MKAVIFALALAALGTSAAYAGCMPTCQQVPDGKGGMATVCYCR